MRRSYPSLPGRSDGRATRILITGASGLLGGKIVELASGRGHQVYSTYREHAPPPYGKPLRLDQTEDSQVKKFVSENRPDVIINAAALTDVDVCEEKPEAAFLLNATSVGHLADAATESSAFFVQVSTDYVFSGEKGGYSETDVANPINQYGHSKLKGEAITTGLEEKTWSIARASVVYGWGRTHRPNAATYVYSKLSKSEKVSMVADQFSSPTLNTSLASMLVEVAERKIPGIIHTAGASRLSRYDFATGIARTFGLDTRMIASTKSKNLNWKAKRPRDSSLNVTRASQTLLNRPLTVENAFSLLLKEHNGLAPSQRV